MAQAAVSIDPDSLALRDYRLFQTGDVDQAREAISRIMQPHDLQFHGKTSAMHAHMDFAPLRGIGLGTIGFGQAAIDVPPLEDYHLLVFCLSGTATFRTVQGSFEATSLKGVACPPNKPVRAIFSDNCEQFVMRIDSTRLARFAGQDEVCFMPQFDLRAAVWRPFLVSLRNLVTCGMTMRIAQNDPWVAAAYEQLLLRLLLTTQEGLQSPAAHGARPASVHRATGFIEAHFAEPITLSDIAAAAGTPERTLQEAFRKFEATTPLKYLRGVRLDCARRHILAGSSVTAAALAAGFTHLGRFSEDFAARFGYLPSQGYRIGQLE